MMKRLSLEVRASPNGKGVFALRPFARGDVILPFRGSFFHKNGLPKPYDDVEDHYVQIGPDFYIGPSGGADDFVNHSCYPNAGLRIKGRLAALVAIRRINTGDEITWDYSTTMDENGGWEMRCLCGSPHCRGLVRDFRTLLPALKRRYKRLGIVPDYLCDA